MTVYELAKRYMKELNDELIYRLHQSKAGFKSCRWDEIYDSVQEIIDDMMCLDADPKGKPPYKIVNGYEYIQSFQNRISKGMELTDKQIVQIKRLASSIAYSKYVQKCAKS